MSASKRKGTAWESLIVDYLREHGAPHAERRALAGTHDRGDIAGIPGVVIEAKSAARLDLSGWLAEAEQERRNDGADIGVVWAKRIGKSSPGDGYAVMSGATLVRLLTAAGYIQASGHPVGTQVLVDLFHGEQMGTIVRVTRASSGEVWEYDVRLPDRHIVACQPQYVRLPQEATDAR